MNDIHNDLKKLNWKPAIVYTGKVMAWLFQILPVYCSTHLYLFSV